MRFSKTLLALLSLSLVLTLPTHAQLKRVGPRLQYKDAQGILTIPVMSDVTAVSGNSTTGATGATGPAGPTPTISVSVATGAPGSAASVTKTGSGTAIGFSFTLPRGDVGATGAPGATGATGATGPPGATGPAGPGGGGGSTNANVISVFTPTVAGIQTAINSVTAAGTVIQLAFIRCDFGDAEQVQIINRLSLTIQGNGALLIANQSRTMIYINGSVGVLRITNVRIINTSPTLAYGVKYGYFATISTDSDTQCEQLEIDHIEGTTPNADQDFFLGNTYRDVQGNNGSTCLLKSVNIHHNNIHDVGRMAVEIINGGPSYGDFTNRYVNTIITNNVFRQLGLVNASGYGMAVSLDGPHNGAIVAGNTIRDARGTGIEDVNGQNVNIVNNIITDDLTNASLPGCVGISITDNRRFISRRIQVIGNTVDVKKRAIQAYEVSYLTVSGGNNFQSVLGCDFVVKRSKIDNNTFIATAPTEPVLSFHATSANSLNWTSTENTITNNTITNSTTTKPSGYTGPYQLLRFNDGSKWNRVDGNLLLMDASVNTANFAYLEFLTNSAATDNYVGENITRVARSLGYGD